MAAGLLSPAFLAACGKKSRDKDTLRIALRGEADSLDPFKAEFAIANLLFSQYLLPLVGFGDNGKAIPAIATSWQGSNDSKTWLLNINQGLKWSDGQPLKTDDILYSFWKAADWKTAYPDAPELFSIVGFEKAMMSKGDPKTIGVKKIAPDKIQIDLLASDARFPLQLQEFFPVPAHIVDKFGEDWTKLSNIVVSGPYKPTIFTQTRIKFDKQDSNDWAALGFNPNMPKAIDVDTVQDIATRLRMYQAGDVDIAQDPPLFRYDEIKQKYGSEFIRLPAPLMIYMSLNTKRPALQDKDVRRALGMAFDRTFIADKLMRGAVHPANRIVRDEPLLPYDPEGAKKILESKGYNASNQLKFEFLVPKDERERAAVKIVDSWKAIGVEATIASADTSAISARLNGHDFDAAIVKIDKGLKSDPIDLMASFASGGNAYSHQWVNKDFDAALNYARSIADEAKRKAAVLAAEKYLIDDAPILPIWFGDSAWLIGNNVDGGRKDIPPVIWPTLQIK